jgi:hypothetical protein
MRFVERKTAEFFPARKLARREDIIWATTIATFFVSLPLLTHLTARVELTRKVLLMRPTIVGMQIAARFLIGVDRAWISDPRGERGC